MISTRAFLSLGLLASVLASVPAFASTPAPTTSTNVTIFPPANESTGGGLLAFPPGSNKSYYAVPVIYDDPGTVAAIKAQTDAIDTQTQVQAAAIQAQTAAITNQTGAINSGVAQLVAAIKSISIGTSASGGGGGGEGWVSYPNSVTCDVSIAAGEVSGQNPLGGTATYKWAAEQFSALTLYFRGLANGQYVYQVGNPNASSNFSYTFTDTTSTTSNKDNVAAIIEYQIANSSFPQFIFDAQSGKLLNVSSFTDSLRVVNYTFPSSAIKYTLVCPQHL